MKKVKHPAYRPKGTGIGTQVCTRINKDVLAKLEKRNVNISKAVRDFLTTLAGE